VNRPELPGASKLRAKPEGCPQIAAQINLAFGTTINKDVVRRILALHFRPTSTEGGTIRQAQVYSQNERQNHHHHSRK
jgi:hypothetical protein